MNENNESAPVARTTEGKFAKGHKKLGGKKSLTPGTGALTRDIRKIKKDVRSYLDEVAVNPIAELLKLARRKATPVDVRAKIYVEICKFAYPRLSTVAVQHSGKLDHSHEHIQSIMLDPALAEAAEKLSLALTSQIQVAQPPRLPAAGDVFDVEPLPADVPEENQRDY